MNELEFDQGTHTYRIGDLIVPSVTQLLREFGLIDFNGVPESRLEYKRTLGLAVHTAIQFLNEDNLDEESLSEAIVPYVDAYKRFREVTGFETRFNELRLYSKKWKFAGTPDEQGVHISKVGEEEALIDYKCTWRPYVATGNQLAGYQMLVEENLGIKIKKRFGLHLKPTGHYDLIPYTDSRDFLEFQACLVLHWAKREKHKTLKGPIDGE